MELKLIHTTVKLLPEKALFVPAHKALVITDLHLGKAMHFRKSGIAIPQQSAHTDYVVLRALINKTKPKKIIIIGDLFHSKHNSEWNLFCDFVNAHPAIAFTLVIGNHDILERSHYEKLCMKVIEDTLEMDELLFSHEPLKSVPRGKINIAGHIHPAVVLYGKGRQRLKLPCFYLAPQLLIIPAFGSLTGLHVLDAEGGEVFVVLENKVVHIPKARYP